jgi:hypothetical protein
MYGLQNNYFLKLKKNYHFLKVMLGTIEHELCTRGIERD